MTHRSERTTVDRSTTGSRDHEAAFRTSILDIRDYEPGADAEQVAQATGIPFADIVKLASNENDFPISEAVTAAITRQFPLLHSYPWEDYGRLKAAVAAANSVPSGQVVLSSGSAQLVLNLPLLYTDPGDEVILAPQSYALYEAASQVMGARLRQVPLADYRFDIPAIVATLTERTKIVWLCSPNNPTGTIVTRRELQTLLDAAPATTAIVVDQAYCEFVNDPEYADPLELLAAGHRNVIALRSFSKAYALAGIRLGYAIADPVVCRMLNRIAEPFLLSRTACAAGLAALGDAEWLRASSAAVREGREYLSRELAALGWNVVPSQGNFVLADTHRDGRALFLALLERGVIVRPADGWGYPTHIRVSVGLPDENRRLLKALRDCLQP
jgi:histidinol-phosphate aminotransferase